MITRDPQEFLRWLQAEKLPANAPPVARACFLVEPAGFRISEQTAQDNQYMEPDAVVNAQRAIDQHRQLGEAISDAGITALRFAGKPETPDDVFPNNVFATVPGRLIIGSMLHPERRLEAERQDIRQFFNHLLGYSTVDLSTRPVIAELTGSVVIDRARQIGFCGMTQRVDDAGCQAMHEAFGFAATFQFDLKPEEYHTNVVMAVLASRALVICPDAFVDPAVPAAIAEVYPERVITISREQKEAYAGNIIALSEQDLFVSDAAADALGAAALEQLRSWGFIVHRVALDEIEKAGGSLRCTVAEIY
ncbi:MAG: arginine deiminase-related protein [Wenzhouxiangellaceae bacterium]